MQKGEPAQMAASACRTRREAEAEAGARAGPGATTMGTGSNPSVELQTMAMWTAFSWWGWPTATRYYEDSYMRRVRRSGPLA